MIQGTNRLAGRQNNFLDLNEDGSIEASSGQSAIIVNGTQSSEVPVTTPPVNIIIPNPNLVTTNLNTPNLPFKISGSWLSDNPDSAHQYGQNIDTLINANQIYLYNFSILPYITSFKTQIIQNTTNDFTTTWEVTFNQSPDGLAYMGFTSRGSIGDNYVNRTQLQIDGNPSSTDPKEKTPLIEKLKSLSTTDQFIEINKIADINQEVINGNGLKFRQVFYQFTKPKYPPYTKNTNTGTILPTPITPPSSEEEIDLRSQFLDLPEDEELVGLFTDVTGISLKEFMAIDAAITKVEIEEDRKAGVSTSGCKYNDIKPCTVKQTGKPEKLASGLYSPLPKDSYTKASTYKNHGTVFTRGNVRLTTAIDLGTKRVECVPIYAISGGRISYGGSTGNYCNKDGGMSFHLYTKINGVIYDILYGHLNERVVTNGAIVSAGQLLGYSGDSGHSSTPHLHLEVQSDKYGNKYAGTYSKVQTTIYDLLKDSRFYAEHP